jgi:Domain of Unknown Function (DUF1080)
MRFRVLTGGIAAALVVTSVALAETIDFETNGAAGGAPQGFTSGTTNPGKTQGDWKLQEVAGAPSGKLAVIQLSADPKPSSRFPVLVYDRIVARDADFSVRFKAVSGKDDQAAGLVWRYKDEKNYYIVRANALEDNVVLYIVKDGKRADLPVKGKGKTYGEKAPVSKTEWSSLGMQVRGDNFKVIFNGQLLFEVDDKTFPDAGKIGLWTKADSVMLFDDLVIDAK